MKQSTKPALIMAAGLLATLGGIAVAQNSGNQITTNQIPGQTGTSGQTATLSKMDKTFMLKAEQANIAEIKSSQLAVNKANKQGLKDFAQHMIDDHTTAESDLKELAQNKNYTLPTDTDAKSQAVGTRLTKLSGAAFDSTYTKAQHNGHVAAIALFKKEIASGSDPDVKAYAQKYLPKIQGHLQDLNSLTGGSHMRHSGATGTSGSSSQR